MDFRRCLFRAGMEQGKRLIRLSRDKGLSLSERGANYFYRLTWRTPLHAMRLKGKYPLKLLAVPDDPIPGDERAGKALRAGYFLFRGTKQPLASLDFSNLDLAPAFVDYIHRSEEHTSELQSLMRISYAVFCLKKKKKK